MFNNTTYRKMTVKEVLNRLDCTRGAESDKQFVALLTALLPFLTKGAEKRLDAFVGDWNFNQPYEYYQSEVLGLTKALLEENLGKPVSFFGRLVGKRVLQWDSIVRVEEC